MATDWTLDELRRWDERIREKVDAFGLEPREQEFEICDREEMLGYMAYRGLPAHYPHWSFGKAYERLKTLHEHGLTGLPYEMVINSDPCLAYLMRDNSLCLQILTIAHVYGHNDFFARNFHFQGVRAELAVSRAKLQAERVRRYVEDPSIGEARVEEIVDAAHALSLHLRRNPRVRKLSRGEQEERALERARPRRDPPAEIHARPEPGEADLTRVPIEPEEDLLLFIRDHNPYLEDWAKDVLTIVHDQARYFLPQIETKIMNEGWATYWHHRILSALRLPPELHIEFAVHHNQVVQHGKGSLNPYHLGFVLWHDVRRRAAGEDGRPGAIDSERLTGAEAESGALPGEDELFSVREEDRDVSFLRRFLDEELMRELDVFEYEKRSDELVVSRISDPDHWSEVKATLLRQVGMGSIPVIRIEDADVERSRILLLRHEHDGRDLDLDYARETLRHVHRLWGRKVLLETTVADSVVRFSFSSDGFRREAA
jgi:stage V sporulation protein R